MPNIGVFFFGVVSISLRKEGLHITSALLRFEDDQRVAVNGDTVLRSVFKSGEWEDFVWHSDSYSEWECERASDLLLG